MYSNKGLSSTHPLNFIKKLGEHSQTSNLLNPPMSVGVNINIPHNQGVSVIQEEDKESNEPVL